jgi:uncharacterized membrane protein YgdD (TMEM256/DUF423 family)
MAKDLAEDRCMTKQDKIFLIIGALLLSTGAMLSAYGFHGLADSLTDADRLSWRWAVQMQTYHSLALLVVTALNIQLGPSKLLVFSRWLFVFGMAVFCGSIYTTKMGAPASWGEVAPIGGGTIMLAWIITALAFVLTPAKD